MLNKTKLRREHRRRRLDRMASLAHRVYPVESKPDQLDELLGGLDDGWDRIRERIITLAGERGEWAGYPLPIEHAELVIEPGHPLYATMNGASLGKKDEDDDDSDVEIVNEWKDYDRGRHVYLIREKSTGKVRSGVLPLLRPGQRAELLFGTLGASQAWSVSAEFTAMQRLKTLVTPTAFRYYLLTGTFLESSKRSGVIYMFRKARPTLAIKGTLKGDNTTILAALCLHPIGFYRGTFAGSMVPTDDVIAHLIMMRGDERKYWAKCNQHEVRSAEAGL
jgi:hypothetical protein